MDGQHHGADQPGVIAQGCRHEAQVFEVGRVHDAVLKRLADGVEQQRSQLGDSAAENKRLGVENVGEAGQRQPDPCGRLTNDGASQFVTTLSRLTDQLGRQGLGPVGQTRGLARKDPLLRLAGDGRAGSDGLQMAPLAATAARSIGLHRQMAQLGCQTTSAQQQLAVDNDTTADPGADRQVEHVVRALSGAMTPFGQRRQISIIAEADGPTQLCGQFGFQGDIAPAGQIGGFVDNAGHRVERPGRADADPPLAAGGGQLLDGFDDAANDVVGSLIGLCLNLVGLERARGGSVEPGDSQVGAAQVDRDDVGGHCGSIACQLDVSGWPP